MHFVIYCVDKPDHGPVRAANRPAHVEYLKAQGDKILIAGPTTSEDGDAMTGSVIIIDFANSAEAETFAENDPYNQAGLFETVAIKPWKKVIG